MKNKLKSFIVIFFYFFLLCKNVNSSEPFVFNVTEIEILENGNQIKQKQCSKDDFNSRSG